MAPHDEVDALTTIFSSIPNNTIEIIFDSYDQNYDSTYQALVEMCGDPDTFPQATPGLNYSRQHVSSALSEREQIEVWADANTQRPAEFSGAAARICIVPNLMGSSCMDHKVAFLDEKISNNPICDSFSKTSQHLIRQAFGLRRYRNARSYVNSAPGGLASGCFYDGLLRVHKDLQSWQRPLLHAAIREMLLAEHSQDDLQVVCGLLLRAAGECEARKQHVFSVVIDRAVGSSLEHPRVPADANDIDGHRKRIQDAAQLAIDDLKDKAFKSVFTEPSKMYYRAVWDPTMEGDVDVHGSNTYLALLLAGLGVKLARCPLLSDEIKGIVAYRDAMSQEDLARFAAMGNVGKSWEAVIGRNRRPSARRIRKNYMFFKGYTAGQLALLHLLRK